ncbi:hypothetical protein A2803_04340 [Candidatus Woesebacteria bacterium RIFCSPHIGHO2_01_FULL_44_21]|uniref:DUF2283 domain-containing protein n=1 Tax=Candidatus Woesebacteria bacterium RIFCSPHIGHO2_01_FULL_44_21 TaxID=1802503 RepID=A0A1F7Z1P5_9BACT|nr:MAG: hypothetical protein A2803_04340 [Candidatus Woesebacteria bacterium RIFCSPHIGHO2_01_FULL_44_21]OGM71497.1 MAG: hypothetical protein A2897_04225 [Candidatus Woesebacteria bacterium RIFCSPLOWO2_01_FULL_44_24b]
MAEKIKREKVYYDKKSDALWMFVQKGIEYESKEISPGVNVELGENGELLGIEILNASKILGGKISNKKESYSPASI